MDKQDKLATFGIVNDWLKFSEAKAGAILAFQSAIVGLLISQTSDQWATLSQGFWISVPSALGAFGLLLSIWFSGAAIYPRLSVGEPKSALYFAHIAKVPSAEAYSKRLTEKDVNFEADLEGQIWANSRIAWRKYLLINRAIWSAVGGYLCIGIAWLIKLCCP